MFQITKSKVYMYTYPNYHHYISPDTESQNKNKKSSKTQLTLNPSVPKPQRIRCHKNYLPLSINLNLCGYLSCVLWLFNLQCPGPFLLGPEANMNAMLFNEPPIPLLLFRASTSAAFGCPKPATFSPAGGGNGRQWTALGRAPRKRNRNPKTR